MLTPDDDHPIHQTQEPIAHTVDADPNRYDRYFFNGYDADRGLYFGATLGVYPNRNVIDAAVVVALDGVQRSVFASGRLGPDRRDTRVGPIRVEVLEPLRTLRVSVDSPEHGVALDVTFEARTAAIEEPRQRLLDRTRVIMDSTRLTQFGTWSGTVVAGDVRIPLDPSTTFGTRDRSWGLRPLGGGPEVAPSGLLPEVFWIWAPVHLDDRCLHGAVFEDAKGERSFEAGVVTPVIGAGEPTWGPAIAARHARDVAYEVQWELGTRRAREALVTLQHHDGPPDVIELDPLFRVAMRGLAYTHPDWGHGLWRGEEVVGGEELRTDDLDPTDLSALHVQQVCRVRVGDQTGVGILEQLCIGEHHPSGLTGFVDGATA